MSNTTNGVRSLDGSTVGKRPNILIIIADQTNASSLPVYGHSLVKAPNLSKLGEEGVVFDSAYCNSPLCAPSRASIMTGLLPSNMGTYDNAAEFSSSIPTFAHYLRAAGYYTCLSGKMHFCGPDQLHGFEERLTTDIYPSDFGWTPDWTNADQRATWYHNMLSVVQAGTCVTSNQLDFDEETAFLAVRKLYELARQSQEEARPFCMTVSFAHPHDPYAVPKEYWDRYDHQEIDLPKVPRMASGQVDPHSQRMFDMYMIDEFDITDEHVRNARHAYYGAISYIDDKVGQLMRTLKDLDKQEDTIIIFTTDHGDMLGERGLWYKMTFYENSARIPFIVNAPKRFTSHRVDAPVSLVDLLPTLLDLVTDGQGMELAGPLDGTSLYPQLTNNMLQSNSVVASEYTAEGVAAPYLMLRRGTFKYMFSETYPEQLYDLSSDPYELNNLASHSQHENILQVFRQLLHQRWDPEALREKVITSQRQRRLVNQAIVMGRRTVWDFQPFVDASLQYIRSHLDLNALERRARYPAPPVPDKV